MSVEASKVARSGARGKELDGLIRQHFDLIDDKLLRAERTWGRNVVMYELPMALQLPGLDRAGMELILFSRLIERYVELKYEVGISLRSDTPSCQYLAWMTDLDKAEVDKMTEMVRSHVLKDEAEVEKFIGPAGAAGIGRSDRRTAPRPAKLPASGQLRSTGPKS